MKTDKYQSNEEPAQYWNTGKWPLSNSSVSVSSRKPKHHS